jgi:enamine deaminase RidA (YjgF/YER057c/UK114 family)
MQASRNALFESLAAELGVDFCGEIKIGGNYVSVVTHRNEAYVSGQVPRIGDTVVVTGRVGADVTLDRAQLAARICALRALALLRRTIGNLDRIERILRVGVFVQSAEGFTQQSEVADAASQVLHSVLGAAGTHTRTSVGVYQLPKNAAVELDLIAAIR